ncbi:MAG: glycosyltransferase family 4 protein [Firmicutes bacterium]|jgi:glycosyltransferase involved in cell wall biosynthesis|nr:glycosyltransferase family 4 protein [Bacillota bacterium]
MKIAMLSPIAWRTPPRHYGPWEQVVSWLTEGLVREGVEVTLYATADSQTRARLRAVAPRPYAEDDSLDPKVWECLHIASLFEEADRYDLIHSHFDFLPLTYAGLVQTPVLTTIHGFSSPRILPVYQKYNRRVHYVSISNADRDPSLDYCATIYHGIPVEQYPFSPGPGRYLLFFGRIHHDKGAAEAIALARQSGLPLIMAGIIQDRDYFERSVAPYLDNDRIKYIGPVGPADKGALLGGAMALLHLINFDEPFGLSVVEAMACGTPVIACKRGSMPELITDGETGFLIERAEEARACLPRLKELSRRRCRARVEAHFTVEVMVRRYRDLYRQIIKNRQL